MTRFFHYTLRTTNVDAARAFYAAVLGKGDAEIVPLHEQAIARGARPHWLGYLDVGDVDAAASAFGARGATPLAKWVNPQGLEAAVIRDPGGAIVALAKPALTSSPQNGDISSGGTLRPASPTIFPYVIWHVLNTSDVERAKANYRELLGWELQEPVDLETVGVFHPFAWEPGGAPVGGMCDIAPRAGVHPHWLFHFRVPALDSALEAVRVSGGLSLAPIVMPNGDRIAVCDDPQGAAFALFERRE